MASAASSWYTDLDFDSYVLDILLMMWCGGAAMVVMAVNSIKEALGPVTRQPAAERYRGSTDSALASVAALVHKHGESCLWFNTAMSWLYLHYYNQPVYLEQWVKSLNTQLTKLGGPVQNKVEKVQPASLPPRIINVKCQTPADGSVVLLTKLESQDLLLSVFASQQTSEGVWLTNCVAHVLKLNGTLRLKIYREKKDVKVRATFDSRPEVKVEVTPTNPYQDPSTLVDLGVVERNVRNALALAVTTFTITKLLMPGDLSTIPGECPEEEDVAPAKPGEIRKFTAQRAHNKISQVTTFNQQQQQQQQQKKAQGVPPTIQEVTPQSHPPAQDNQPKDGDGVQKASVQPVRQMPPQTGKGTPGSSDKGGQAPLAGAGGL